MMHTASARSVSPPAAERTPPPIELAEHASAKPIPLDDVTGRALAASGLVEVTPDPYLPGHWRVKAGRKVGVATVTVPGSRTVTVRITPKTPIARLLFLLGYSLDPKGWRNDDADLASEPDLLPALARLFARQAEHALRQGLLQGYRRTEETSLVIRGRILEGEQIRRQHGRLIPIEVAHDEYTTDITENRLLRTASDRLMRLPTIPPAGIPTDARACVLRLRARLADITPIGCGHEIPAWRPTRLNARYHRALRLAELVLRGFSVEHRTGDVTVSGFLFDMAKVFEDFVTVALREALADQPGRCAFQDGQHLDEHGQIRIVPDFVRYAEDGTPLAVADAKYKAEEPDGFPHTDLYQMLAYCTVLGMSEGHLVYAKGNGPHAAHRVRRSGIVIHQHALDLDQSPAGLLAGIRDLALRLDSSLIAAG
ncbi:McrC family protein [Nonomuraea sp. H19]|uniref:McrC family protein n=1 Tax=Nonomuraea sp. H19 TaxID=3452206 RepID=UPI003F8CBD14